MARLNISEQEEDEHQILSKTCMSGMIIFNLFWVVVLGTAVLLNLREGESFVLRNWNYVVISCIFLSAVLLGLYIKTKNSVLLMSKIIIRTCMGVIFIIVITAQFFSRYKTTYSKTIQYLDLAFAICEVTYLCFMLSSVDNYYYEEAYRSQKNKNTRQYHDYSSI